MNLEGSAVAMGIDAAVVAEHRVVIRSQASDAPGMVDQFSTAPTPVGLEALSKRLRGHWRWPSPPP
jgi:hypothetical protein